MDAQIDLIANINQEENTDLSLWEQIKEDWIAHGKDWTKPGFRAIAVHRFGVWYRGIKSKLLQLPFRVIYGILYRRVRNHYGIELPYNVKVGRRVVIHHQGTIVINSDCTLGDDCQICQGVTLGSRYPDRGADAPQLGKHVEVCAGAKVFGRVMIGDHAKIGANAVVLCDVPAGATAVGIPARIIVKDQSHN